MKVLLIEDDQFKARRLSQLVREIRCDLTVDIVGSVTGSIRALETPIRYDLVVLDMSLPTFDVGPRESGGIPQGFGGREVMRFMINNEVDIPVVIVTQFERFGEVGREIDLSTLSRSLGEEFPEIFVGIVYYEAGTDRWQEELIKLIGPRLRLGSD